MYYEFTEAALSDGVAWERLADSVAVEVRRHGAPAPSSDAVTGAVAAEAMAPDAVDAAAASPAKIAAAAAHPMAPMREDAAPSVGVSSVVHTTVNNNNNSNNTNNSCDTTLVFM